MYKHRRRARFDTIVVLVAIQMENQVLRQFSPRPVSVGQVTPLYVNKSCPVDPIRSQRTFYWHVAIMDPANEHSQGTRETNALTRIQPVTHLVVRFSVDKTRHDVSPWRRFC